MDAPGSHTGHSPVGRTSNTRAYRQRTQPPGDLDHMAALAGVRFNGDRPWDIQVRNPRMHARVLHNGCPGSGESCMDGDRDAERLDELFSGYRARTSTTGCALWPGSDPWPAI